MHIKINNWFQNHLNPTKQMYKQAWISCKKNQNKTCFMLLNLAAQQHGGGDCSSVLPGPISSMCSQ